MSKAPMRVAVTGAAGQIGYSLLFRIASGEMLGKDQPVILQLLDLPQAQQAVKGVMMELDDCAFPLLAGMVATDDPNVAFKDADVCLLVGARPRTKGMERADLLTANGAIFTVQGKAIAENAKGRCQSAGRRQPVQHQRLHRRCCRQESRPHQPEQLPRHAASGPQPRPVATGREDRPRRVAVQEAHRLGQPLAHDVRRLPQLRIERRQRQGPDQRSRLEQRRVPADRRQARRRHHRGPWPVVGRFGANAAIDHVRDWVLGSNDWVTMGVPSDGSYDIPEGHRFGFPCECKGGSFKIIQGLEIDAYSREKINLTLKELTDEAEAVKDML